VRSPLYWSRNRTQDSFASDSIRKTYDKAGKITQSLIEGWVGMSLDRDIIKQIAERDSHYSATAEKPYAGR